MSRACLALLMIAGAAGPIRPARVVAQQSDLDAFMQRVVARRDDNWKKLQQYVLDERQQLDITGPGRIPLWGERREFTWYLRDGFFVRSPVKVNGVEISEPDRRRYEERYLRRVQRRDRRELENPDPDTPAAAPADVNALIRQSTEPEFISSANFLRFKFDEGRYALVGREQLDGRDVLRIEYYPTRLFEESPAERAEREARRRRDDSSGRQAPGEPVAAEARRLMNKTSLVTLWVDQSAHQILQYTFDNVDLDFFPGSWLMHANGATATMTMSQPFPDVWLPRRLDMNVDFTLAIGQIDFRFALEYLNYRQADVTSVIRMPGDPGPR